MYCGYPGGHPGCDTGANSGGWPVAMVLDGDDGSSGFELYLAPSRIFGGVGSINGLEEATPVCSCISCGGNVVTMELRGRLSLWTSFLLWHGVVDFMAFRKQDSKRIALHAAF